MSLASHIARYLTYLTVNPPRDKPTINFNLVFFNLVAIKKTKTGHMVRANRHQQDHLNIFQISTHIAVSGHYRS